MNVRPDSTSPWGKRIWIADCGFDSTMDALRHRVGQTACEPGRGIDVDAVLLQGFGVDPSFVSLPDGCLGRTTFQSNGSFEVEICRVLGEEAETSAMARRRLRSTLAHEASHIELHAVLHPIATASLFEDLGKPPTAVMCRRPSETCAASGPWWEYQANRGMASLLVPRALVRDQFSAWLAAVGAATITEVLTAGRVRVLASDLADEFDVSLEMMVYRLGDIGLLPQSAAQAELAGL